jgi:hypothetical protein
MAARLVAPAEQRGEQRELVGDGAEAHRPDAVHREQVAEGQQRRIDASGGLAVPEHDAYLGQIHHGPHPETVSRQVQVGGEVLQLGTYLAGPAEAHVDRHRVGPPRREGGDGRVPVGVVVQVAQDIGGDLVQAALLATQVPGQRPVVHQGVVAVGPPAEFGDFA